MKKISILLLFSFISLSFNAQTSKKEFREYNKLRKKFWRLISKVESKIDTTNFHKKTLIIDSLNFDIKDYGDKVSFIAHSEKNNIDVDFYLIDNHILAIKSKEKNLFYSDLSAYIEVMYKDDNLIYEDKSKSVRTCMAWIDNITESTVKDYDPAFTLDFVKKYSFKILSLIK